MSRRRLPAFRDISPAEKSYEKLKRSISEFGYVEPVIRIRQTGNVFGGYRRLKVLMDLGHTEIDCVVVDHDLQREKAFNIAINKIQGDWDEGRLALLMADFDTEKAAREIEESGGPAAQPGNLWRLGDHLLCGDPASPESYERLMTDARAQCAITAPSTDPKAYAREGVEPWLTRMASVIRLFADANCRPLGIRG
ncbi:MAG: ParB N-terminal domain-containing protein [Christensenellaceae bacterium]|nr:ParB N-terminal domain-containing protein [Christensenellaceae bacterium]MEA5065947.1 ParB N-terminal domain-containing protein [Eubacteriales bacterium]MEA5069310.1 ParB N-terminal domain-containing protein [Christensenellaceae bacterium]